jgi:hypothetical protein
MSAECMQVVCSHGGPTRTRAFLNQNFQRDDRLSVDFTFLRNDYSLRVEIRRTRDFDRFWRTITP